MYLYTTLTVVQRDALKVEFVKYELCYLKILHDEHLDRGTADQVRCCQRAERSLFLRPNS